MKFIDKAQDPWHMPLGEDGPTPHPVAASHRLLTLEQWHAVRATWPASLPTGVAVPNDADIEQLEPDLPRLQLVALQFPKWVDGRAYSQAHLLRERFGYTGEVRATGEVLVDMLPLMQRTGFDTAVLRGDQSREAAERALAFFPGHYQGDVREPRPWFARPAGEEREFVQTGAAI
ncbi:DUF934 domain-containing protein [Aquabacterium sp. J223]|uniref:DUF934 domain-containing protein n=1 Tax=Aquabacterium sp. J223 TaxID=2898431 RepID=UPI0021ADB314|nr:DUF934 domain-containing protein [Aquabacterium sp. J223]UUX97482.1 DUF934 domain-containing protein [Aquabacterium sp. J223]